MFINDYEDTSKAYLNSIVIALCATALCVTIGPWVEAGFTEEGAKNYLGAMELDRPLRSLGPRRARS